MGALDDPTPAKGRLTITVDTASLSDGDGKPAGDDHLALLNTLYAAIDTVRQDLSVLPYAGGEWVAETQSVQTPSGTATITLS